MQKKMLGSVLAAAVIGFSANAFAQDRTISPERYDARQGANADMRMDNARGDAAFRCDTLSGDERMRCLQTTRNTAPQGIYTQRPGDSGPGAVDKTHPGYPVDAAAARDAGTSSAGSGS